MSITTLLWIGPGRGFPAELTEDPRLDIVWHDGCPARTPGCDLVVLDAESEGAIALREATEKLDVEASRTVEADLEVASELLGSPPSETRAGESDAALKARRAAGRGQKERG